MKTNIEKTENIYKLLTQEYTGKTVEDTTKSALKELNVSKEEVNIKVLSEGSQGLFGLMGSKPARVIISPKLDRVDCAIKIFVAKLFKCMSVGNLSIDAKLNYNILNVNIYIKDEVVSNILRKNNFELYNSMFIMLKTFLQNIHNELDLSLDINNLRKIFVNKAKMLISSAKAKGQIVLRDNQEVFVNILKSILRTYHGVNLSSIRRGRNELLVLRKR